MGRWSEGTKEGQKVGGCGPHFGEQGPGRRLQVGRLPPLFGAPDAVGQHEDEDDEQEPHDCSQAHEPRLQMALCGCAGRGRQGSEMGRVEGLSRMGSVGRGMLRQKGSWKGAGVQSWGEETGRGLRPPGGSSEMWREAQRSLGAESRPRSPSACPSSQTPQVLITGSGEMGHPGPSQHPGARTLPCWAQAGGRCRAASRSRVSGAPMAVEEPAAGAGAVAREALPGPGKVRADLGWGVPLLLALPPSPPDSGPGVIIINSGTRSLCPRPHPRVAGTGSPSLRGPRPTDTPWPSTCPGLPSQLAGCL